MECSPQGRAGLGTSPGSGAAAGTSTESFGWLASAFDSLKIGLGRLTGIGPKVSTMNRLEGHQDPASVLVFQSDLLFHRGWAMKRLAWSVSVLVLAISCERPRKDVAVSELIGTYVATFKDPPDMFELRKDRTYKHVAGPRSLVSYGKWAAETEHGTTTVSLYDFLMNWPKDVPDSGRVGGWEAAAEALRDGSITLSIPGSPYSYVKHAPRG
jgi:hypothetical protein